MNARMRGALAGLLVMSGAAALAHHSPAMFDFQKQATVTGTVRAFQWTNPHAYIQLMVKDPKGLEQEWSFEMGAPMYLKAHGWRPSTLKNGQTITITYATLRKGGHAGLALSVLDAAGKPVGGSTQEAK